MNRLTDTAAGSAAMVRKGTRAHREEYVYAYIGLDRLTLDIRTIMQRRDGVLVDGERTHAVPGGRRAETELVIVFGLLNAKVVPMSSYDAYHEEIREALRQEAAQMRESHPYRNT